MKTFNHYRILSLLGQGGMGTVYLAEHLEHRYKVALKVLLPRFSGNTTFVQRFWREYQTVRSLTHPHIVRVYEFGNWQGHYFIASEYINGLPLDRLLEQGRRLNLKQTVSVTQQIANALDAAHQRGIVHRDLKPGNVLQEKGGRIVLTDFGIASILDRDSNLTRNGEVIGTCAYMAPEQIDSQFPLTYRADIYALGVLTYRMLTGREPFQRENHWAVLRAHLRESPPSLRPFGVSPAVEEIVLRTLRKVPEQRPLSASEFATQLTRAAGLSVSVTPSFPRGKPIQRTFPVLWVVLAMVLIFSLIGVLSLVRSGQSYTVVLDFPWTMAYVCGERGDNLCVVEHSGARRIFSHGTQSWSPAWSPDGKKLAFAADANGEMGIWILSLDTDAVSALSHPSGYEAWSPSWAPDGQAVVFDQKVGHTYNIFSQRLDGSVQTWLTSGDTLDSDPDWSPTGEQIAFVSDRDGNLEIYVMEANGRNVTRLTDHPGRDFAPVWSPDGEWIAYECQDQQGADIDICIMDAEGGRRQVLTRNVVDDRQPAWSPDGQYIAFTRQRTGSPLWDIWVMRRDGSEERVLIQDRYSSTHPSWKP